MNFNFFKHLAIHPYGHYALNLATMLAVNTESQQFRNASDLVTNNNKKNAFVLLVFLLSFAGLVYSLVGDKDPKFLIMTGFSAVGLVFSVCYFGARSCPSLSMV